MKISKSKQELARIISENGGWREEAESAAQCVGGEVSFWHDTATKQRGEDWCGSYLGACDDIRLTGVKLPNWHQTILSSAEYFHLYPAPDADGWIEHDGKHEPEISTSGLTIWCKWSDGLEQSHEANMVDWIDDSDVRVVAYRQHKHEKYKPEFCESVMRSIPEPDERVLTNTPSIEQLAADYRNAKDYANRKQDEADKANMDSDAALSELEAAIASIVFAITPLGSSKQEPDLVITDWRDLQVGDEIYTLSGEVVTVTGFDKDSCEWPVLAVSKSGGDWIVGKDGFTFIRRP